MWVDHNSKKIISNMGLISGKTKLLGIIGDPIEHSLSPVMQNEALSHLDLDFVYIPFPVKVANLGQVLAGFEAIGLVGFNATIPHKQAIIPFLNEVNPTAKAIGAVNTVWWSERGWQGTNTDVIGFISPLKRIERNWNKVKPVILGNGGAARAVVAGLAELGCSQINVVGRNKDKLAQFWQSWQDSPKISALLKIHYWENLPSLVAEADLLVNTTPIGMYPHGDRSPISPEIMSKIKPKAIAYDLIYTPSPTKFLQLAQTQGSTIIDGLEMLVQQGAAALEIWVGQPISNEVAEIMMRSLQQKLFG